MSTPRVFDRQGEMDLWKRWKSGDQAALQPLMDRFKPTVSKWVSQHASPNVPPITLRITAINNLKKSLDSYDPTRGANLNTHVTWGLKKGSRVLQKHTNVARIPEPRAMLIGDYQRARVALEDRLGRAPTTSEIRDYIAADFTLDPSKRSKFNLKTIERLEKELRGEVIYSSAMESFTEGDEAETNEILSRDLLYHSLTKQDQMVFENAFGYGGKPVLPNVQIAKMVGVSPTTVGKKIRKFKTEYHRLIA